MRKIKFRAWDDSIKCMYEDIYVHSSGRIYDLAERNYNTPHIEIEEVKSVVLMQYTGIKDKDGVRIFEGDIIKCTSKIYDNFGANETGEYEETIKQVVWKEDGWGTRVISSNLTSKGAEKSGLVISAKYAEVIGNIYQNKEVR